MSLLAPTLSGQMTDFTKLSIDELMKIEIVSVSKKPETVFDSAAAVFVITGEDVHRSGATSLSSALRLSPGMHVARINNSNVAVSARGFNDVSANKLLVMIDGRSVYSPLFSGVLWEDHEFVLEDLDRMEIIRGPGATLWGANAVNGVVNISSKSANDTIGTLVSIAAGDWLNYSATARYGWHVSDHASMRVFAKISERDPADDAGGAPQRGSRSNDLVGFRYDQTLAQGGTLTLQGDWRRHRTETLATAYSLLPPYATAVQDVSDRRNFNLLGRVVLPVTGDGELSLQAYYDYTDNDRLVLSETRHLFDLDTQYRRGFGDRHEVVAGFELRLDRDKLPSTSAYVFAPESMTSRLVSAFVQDEITFVPDRASITLGAKLEDGETSDAELQPSARFVFKPRDDQTLWASVARAARTPSRGERTARLLPQVIPPSNESPLPTQVIIDADPDFDSEYLTAYEIGYRWSSGPRLSCDLATFYNRYSGLRSIEPIGTEVVYTPVPHVEYRSVSGNGINGCTYGVELVTNWQPTDAWRLQGTVSILRYDLELAPGSVDMGSLSAIPGSSPRAQISLRSQWDVTDTVCCDMLLQHTGALAAANVPAYTGLDIRVAWTPRPYWEVSLVGQDLLDRRHPEFPPTFLGGCLLEIPRSCYTRVTLRF